MAKAKPSDAAPEPQPGRSPGGAAISGASGAGVGTAVVVWANGLPADHPYKVYFLVLAPTLAVVATGLAALLNRLGRWAMWDIRHRYGIGRMRKTIKTQLGEPNLSPERVAELNGELVELGRRELADQKGEYLSPPP